MIIDTHCHIDLYQNPRKILQDCVKANITILAMTNLPSHFEMGYSHFQSLKKIRLALGMHPLMADSHKKEFNSFLKNISKTSYIGEIGLDFSKEGVSTKDIQLDTFSKILKAISGQKKILSIHSRKAEKEVLELLKKNNIRSAIFHWYSGGLTLIDEIVQEGYYFSINQSMIKSMSGRKIISKIPRHLILTETDGPFINVNNSPIIPGEVRTVISFLASEWKINENDVENLIWSNFKSIVSSLK
ncbi:MULTISPECIES: Qat anti-phage system TatD family nuclease QatD [Chryseobacterium]|uniref:Qat anti-phage system TatD family nuclease QatD n=1 Tax=Chryseobacterium TaxID=59732 RepID=UPI0011176655|nr:MULTISPECIES: Qat anti-phage system TatD family nuclease QatD [Chryseobacterium]QQQ27710.1 TatD family hydrolase [Chryseobacterium indoltheticum]